MKTTIAFMQEGDKVQHGIMALSSVLKKEGFKTDIFSIQSEKENIVDKILEFNPSILAMSVMTPGFAVMASITREIKMRAPGIITIMGGPHPTFFPQLIKKQDCIDAVCVGEGEYALLELAQGLEKNELRTDIQNLWMKVDGQIVENEIRPLIDDLDTLPIPDYEVYFQRYPYLMDRDYKYNVGRGCPFPCTYCFNISMVEMYKGKGGNWVRYKSADKIMEELTYLKTSFPMKVVSFNDDTFNINKKKLAETMSRYEKEIKLPFLCQLKIDCADEETVAILKKAGVDRITVAIENGNEEFRKTMLKRGMTNKQIIEFGTWIKKYDIRLHCVNIVGFPEETLEIAFETAELNAKVDPEMADIGVLSPYPGTAIYNHAKEKGYLVDDYDFNNMTGQKSWSGHKSQIRSEIKNENMPQLISFMCFFPLLVKYPIIKPLVKQLIKIQYNFIYEFIWVVTSQFKIDFKYAPNWKEKRALLKRLFKLDVNDKKESRGEKSKDRNYDLADSPFKKGWQEAMSVRGYTQPDIQPSSKIDL